MQSRTVWQRGIGEWHAAVDAAPTVSQHSLDDCLNGRGAQI